MKRTLSFLDKLTYSLSLFFALDRLAKLAAVIHFFHRPAPSQLEIWPTVTLLQPITRGANALAESLRARARLDYPASIQHLFICDTRDTESQSIVQTFLAAHPMLRAEIVLVETGDAAVASKIRKLQAALSRANGEILCFMDDDVAPRPDALRVVLPYLYRPGAGAAFGLPCYTNWRTPWSSLMSGLVNANMLLSFVALTYLAEPFRITGHIAAFRHDLPGAAQTLVCAAAPGHDALALSLGARGHLAHQQRPPAAEYRCAAGADDAPPRCVPCAGGEPRYLRHCLWSMRGALSQRTDSSYSLAIAAARRAAYAAANRQGAPVK